MRPYEQQSLANALLRRMRLAQQAKIRNRKSFWDLQDKEKEGAHGFVDDIE
jgi:hypothetical protein